MSGHEAAIDGFATLWPLHVVTIFDPETAPRVPKEQWPKTHGKLRPELRSQVALYDPTRIWNLDVLTALHYDEMKAALLNWYTGQTEKS
jgi:hypothetical protein